MQLFSCLHVELHCFDVVLPIIIIIMIIIIISIIIR
jgi:hypothetical protein